MLYAVQAIAPARSNWHQPKARRGRVRIRQSREPMPLPIPRPVRKTATMMESVYTEAPKSNPIVRVQIASDPNAQSPDSAMAT